MLGLVLALSLGTTPYLDEGRKQFAALEFESAARALAVAVEQADLAQADRREAFDLLARSLLALERRDEAEQAYERLLKADPYAPPPNAAPKVVDCFLRGRARAWPKPSVKLTPASVEVSAVTLRVFDPWGLVARVRWFELDQETAFERTAPKVEEHRVTVAPSIDARRLFFDALDPAGLLLDHLEVALEAAPDARPPAPSVWRAVGLGLVVAAGLALVAGGVLLGVAYRAPGTLPDAAAINDWNSGRAREAMGGWATGGAGLALGAAGLVLLLR